MRVLITGAAGFAGGQLARHLVAHGSFEVYGLRRGGKPVPEGVTAVEADLLDTEATTRAIAAAKPEIVYHLAAQSSVSGSWAHPGDTISNNVLAQRNLFEGLLAGGISPVVLVASSAEVYGKVPLDELPASEGRVLRPVSPYGMSKVAQETLAEHYRRTHGFKVIVTRGFNQSGPGQEARLVVSDFAKQTALIEAGKQEPVIRVGNVEARRDFTDVRDVAEAYRLIAEKGASGDVYNICSGEARVVRDVLGVYRRLAKRSFEVREDPARFRPSDVSVMVGDGRKLRERTGWKPVIPFEQMLEDTLNDWRKKIA